MAGVYVVGTVGYMLIQGVTLADAAYMTAITVSGVGFREVFALTPEGRVWTMLVIILGLGTVWFAFTSLVTLFVSGEIRALRWRRRVESTIGKLKGHVILCGYGRMGSLALSELTRVRVPVVVVERRRDAERDLIEHQIPYVIGDATEEDALLQAGILRARALVTVLPHDADNVYITLTARTLQPELQVIARAEQPSTEIKLKRAGASRAICPQVIGATKIINILTRPNVVDFVEVAAQGVDLEMDEFVVGGQSALAGVTLRDSLIRQKTGAIVVAVKRADGETLVNPEPDAVLNAGDTLIIVGPGGVSGRLGKIDPGATTAASGYNPS